MRIASSALRICVQANWRLEPECGFSYQSTGGYWTLSPEHWDLRDTFRKFRRALREIEACLAPTVIVKNLLHRRFIRFLPFHRLISTQPPNGSGRRLPAPYTKLPAPAGEAPESCPLGVIRSGAGLPNHVIYALHELLAPS
jgi:hypothetical protein